MPPQILAYNMLYLKPKIYHLPILGKLIADSSSLLISYQLIESK